MALCMAPYMAAVRRQSSIVIRKEETMATQAQINANRQNAERSTGPRTVGGKAVVSQNAVKHGLFADATVVNGERQADYDLFRDAMVAEMWPVGVIECMMAERIVNLSWRLRRAERMHTEATDHLIIHAYNKDEIRRSMLSPETRQGLAESGTLERDLSLGRAAARDFAIYRTLDKMIIYERRIERIKQHSFCKFSFCLN